MKQSAQKGFAIAQIKLGIAYYYGTNVAKDYSKVLEILAKLASNHNQEAQKYLSYIYEEGGYGITPNAELSNYWASLSKKSSEDQIQEMKMFTVDMKAATGGDKYAQFIISQDYLYGIGVARDYKLAFEWAEKAANQNSRSALYKLYECYLEGIGVEKNIPLAIENCKKAALLKDEAAMFVMSTLYFEGNQVEKNESKSLEYLVAAAAAGLPSAQSKLGDFYSLGTFALVPKDEEKAIKLYQSAAMYDGNAAYQLGLYYYNGTKTTIDFTKAKNLFIASNHMDNANGANILGFFAEKGIGQVIDYEQAYFLYQKSNALGNANAQEGITRIQTLKYAESQRLETLKCKVCNGSGYVIKTDYTPGSSYTTGGETVYGASTITYDVNGKGSMSTNSYKNPTYTFSTPGSTIHYRTTCNICGGTGKHK